MGNALGCIPDELVASTPHDKCVELYSGVPPPNGDFAASEGIRGVLGMIPNNNDTDETEVPRRSLSPTDGERPPPDAAVVNGERGDDCNSLSEPESESESESEALDSAVVRESVPSPRFFNDNDSQWTQMISNRRHRLPIPIVSTNVGPCQCDTPLPRPDAPNSLSSQYRRPCVSFTSHVAVCAEHMIGSGCPLAAGSAGTPEPGEEHRGTMFLSLVQRYSSNTSEDNLIFPRSAYEAPCGDIGDQCKRECRDVSTEANQGVDVGDDDEPLTLMVPLIPTDFPFRAQLATKFRAHVATGDDEIRSPCLASL